MIKSLGRAVLIGLLVLTAVVAAALALAWAALPLDEITVTVDGESFSLAGLDGPRGVAIYLVAVTGIVVAVVASLVMLVVGLAFGALGLAFGLITAAASLALVLAPFALVGWLLWRLFRQRPPAAAVTQP